MPSRRRSTPARRSSPSEEPTQPVDAIRVFACIGGSANTEWAEGSRLVRAADGLLLTGNDLKRVASAVGEGALAVSYVHRFLAER